jgi:CRISPR system Cascade subunit CasC
MSDFLQIHILTAVPPSNLNRDDTGRPKTAIVGGVTRLRLSSQALKRAWRTSEAFSRRVEGRLGQRTQQLGDKIFVHLGQRGLAPDDAKKIARDVAAVFGKVKADSDKNPTRIEQLAFIAPEEWDSAFALADRIAAGESIEPKEAGLLLEADTALDIALFGRMFADAPQFNRDAAAQIAHAITTHAVTVEDDYYTAVDDLKRPAEDAGASFVGELGFGSGVFYIYLCVDRGLLVGNLSGSKELASHAVAGLVEAAATVLPGGKQNSFAAFARAGFVRAEIGSTQPRTLAGAFMRPVNPRETNDLLGKSIETLEEHRASLEKAYGPGADRPYILDVAAGKGTLAGLIDFATS